jgi:hypothetical protein
MAIDIGEDIFSTLVAVSLATIFTLALVHSCHFYLERKNAFEGFDLALDVLERLKNQVLVKPMGGGSLLEIQSERLENCVRLLNLEGLNLRVEVRTIRGELMFSSGTEPDTFQLYFSPPSSASLPAAICREKGSAMPCELSVLIWR